MIIIPGHISAPVKKVMGCKIGSIPNTLFKQIAVLVSIINSIYQGNYTGTCTAAASGEISNVLVLSKKLLLQAIGIAALAKITILIKIIILILFILLKL